MGIQDSVAPPLEHTPAPRPTPPSEHAPSPEHDSPSGTPPGEHALHHEPASKQRLVSRLRRIEGQVRGLQRMVEEERYCPEILTQVAAVQASLRSTAEVLLHDHLRHCVTGALRSGDPQEAEATYRELTDLFKKYGR
jgi:CsoR family transcriptional regulator, copper-sensing transcriptional repressor